MVKKKVKETIKKSTVETPEEKDDQEKTTSSTENPPKEPNKKKKRYGGKIKRVGTGVKNLDSLIQRGFNNNSTNLLVGPSGSGKTILSVQFLIEGIKKGEKCLYIAFEEKREEFYQNLREVGYDLEKLEREGKFFFLEYSPQKVKTMLDEGGGAIETLVLTKKITRIVFDSATSFILLFDNELDKKDATLALFTLVKGWKCTTLLILEEDPKDELKSSKVLNLEADGIILLYFERKEKKRERKLEVLKMRGTAHSLGLHKYEITNKGITVSK
jgi:circadian clock protein KaiC